MSTKIKNDRSVTWQGKTIFFQPTPVVRTLIRMEWLDECDAIPQVFRRYLSARGYFQHWGWYLQQSITGLGPYRVEGLFDIVFVNEDFGKSWIALEAKTGLQCGSTTYSLQTCFEELQKYVATHGALFLSGVVEETKQGMQGTQIQPWEYVAYGVLQ